MKQASGFFKTKICVLAAFTAEKPSSGLNQKNNLFQLQFKRLRNFAFIICLLFNYGCANLGVIQKATYPKLYPNAQTLFESMDKEQALKVLQKVVDTSIHETWHPLISDTKPVITPDGIECVFKIIIHHSEVADIDAQLNKLVYYYKVWDSRDPDENNTMRWDSVSSVYVSPMNYIKYGSCWYISMSGVWNSKSKYYDNGLGFAVFTPEERDRAIAALLWLCPNLK
ncbi:MAG: hypothetical protein V1747_01245 [Candidatus Omnitrophota bacterium]